MTNKQLFKITLNYQGQNCIYHKHANHESIALRLACLDLANSANVNLMPILNYFQYDKKDNYKIERVKSKERRKIWLGTSWRQLKTIKKKGGVDNERNTNRQVSLSIKQEG